MRLMLLFVLLILSNVYSFKLKSSTLCNNRNILMISGSNIKKGITVFASSILLSSNVVLARPEGVNRPDLLPSGEKTSLIG